MASIKQFWILFLLLPYVAKAQIITTIAGNGIHGCDDFGIPATTAKITDPLGCAFDIYGNYYFCNQQCGMVCKVDASGTITTVAGPGTFGVIADGGPATDAYLNYPNDITFDRMGNLFVADANNYRIRKVDIATGIITTIAGIGTIGFGGDGGPATAALFNGINGLCFDRHGNLYVSDGGNNRIRKINTLGIISTFAGTGTGGFSGDGGPATAAKIWSPFDLAIDTMGNLYFPDASNYRVREIDTSGIITTIAGTGIGGYSGDGTAATGANFHPYKIAIDSFENLYLSDSNRIREIDISGIIHTIAGTSTPGYNGDEILADTAEITSPSGIAIDNCGNVYFGDVGNSRIRKVTFPPVVPIISLSGSTTAAIGTIVTLTAVVSGAGASYIIHWMNHGIEFTTTSAPTVTYTKLPGIDTITAKVIPIGYACMDSITTSANHVVVASNTTANTFSLSDLYIFPNPVSESIYVSGLQTGAQYRLLSVVGAVMQQGILEPGNNIISVHSLPPGIYMLEITNKEGAKTISRIVKQ